MPNASIISRDSIESESPADATFNPIVRTAIPDDEKFRTIHIVAYILCAVIGREYSAWNVALNHGFGIFFVAELLTAAGCCGYYLCLSEIWSGIPFSGGCYGLSRASLGFYVGFLDGFCEALVYIAHSGVSALQLGSKMVALFKLPSHYQLLFVFIFYAIAVWLTVQKSLKLLRRTYIVLAAISCLILFMYLFGTLKYVDFLENAPLHNSKNIAAYDNWFVGGMYEFMILLPYSIQPYAGMKSYALLTINTLEPKKALPTAAIIAFCSIFVINMLVVFVFVSQPGGILKTASLPQPMTVGFGLMFGLNKLDTFRLTTWLSLPASFAKLLTYILPGGNLFHCLGNSYYLPPFLCINKTKDRTNGCIVCAAVGIALVLIIHFNPSIDLYNVMILANMITCCTFIYSYIQLKTTYSNVERSFVSPWGITGGVICFVSFSLIGIAAAFFENTWFNIQFAAVYFVILTVYYFAVAKKGENLCEEEDKVFFQLHVKNYNMIKKKHLKHHKKPSSRWKKGVVPIDSVQGSDALSPSVTLKKTKPQSEASKSMRNGNIVEFNELDEAHSPPVLTVSNDGRLATPPSGDGTVLYQTQCVMAVSDKILGFKGVYAPNESHVLPLEDVEHENDGLIHDQ